MAAKLPGNRRWSQQWWQSRPRLVDENGSASQPDPTPRFITIAVETLNEHLPSWLSWKSWPDPRVSPPPKSSAPRRRRRPASPGGSEKPEGSALAPTWRIVFGTGVDFRGIHDIDRATRREDDRGALYTIWYETAEDDDAAQPFRFYHSSAQGVLRLENQQDIVWHNIRPTRDLDEMVREIEGEIEQFEEEQGTWDRYPDRGEQGEFNWSSQHLEDEVLRCRSGDEEGQTWRVGLRCVRLVGRRSRGVRRSNGFGQRSPEACRVRRPRCPVAYRRPWVVVGSVRAGGCRRSVWRPDRLAFCPLQSGKRSRSGELRALACAPSPVGFGEPRQLFRENCVAMRRLGAVVWRIGRRPRSGTAPDGPSARRPPSWPRMSG